MVAGHLQREFAAIGRRAQAEANVPDQLDAARFVAVTNAPPLINVYEEPEFVFNTRYDFLGRFNGEPDYFAA